jgi:hypothetical protein
MRSQGGQGGRVDREDLLGHLGLQDQSCLGLLAHLGRVRQGVHEDRVLAVQASQPCLHRHEDLWGRLCLGHQQGLHRHGRPCHHVHLQVPRGQEGLRGQSCRQDQQAQTGQWGL